MATKQGEYSTIKLSQSEILSAHFGMCWLIFYTNRIAKLVSLGCSTPVLAFTLQSDVKHLHLILKNSELGTEALNVWEEDRDNGYARARDIYYRDNFSLDKIQIRYSMDKVHLFPIKTDVDEEIYKVNIWFTELRNSTETYGHGMTPN